ncbi:hypothetical protein RhiirA4_489534 [Rhizophagus irregularis]|uniref:Uncharacterized protein n=1 Tax=Rhizophagus irregularis TaxID=588596 RepID=A0A2I1HUV1_9GLOM|nr:hypothetical protein RhiirA4_489534 [Rhizophagus irregularis]
MLEHLSMLRKQRSEKTGLRLPEISRKNLQGKTQKAVKIYKLFEKVGIDNIKYITTYSANSISELTNDKVQEIIDNCSLCEHPKELHHMSPKDDRGPSQNHVSNSSEEKLPDENMNTVSKDTPSVKSQVSVLSTSSSGQISKSNKSRLPISILPEDSEEKRKHIIGSTPCPMCNKDHEGENIKGEWGSGMYFGEEAYYLKCRKAFNSGIPIVSVKA